MSTDVYEGRDVLSGRAIRVSVRSGVVDETELVETRADLPWISHALVDLQINGFAGVDINAADLTPEDVSRIARALAERGTGVWIPTVITQSHEYIAEVLRTLAAAAAQDPFVAAAIPFAHIEGPFISPLDGPRGAHDRQFVRDISVEEVQSWQEIFPIGYVTLSPHWHDAPKKIAGLRRLGVRVALGHTHASAE
ncbi:MAG TPA: N-acetylglucosamine-6-phosphate deacetylase, partial [Coriobacteriia bacterium]|nr:N-acetylglucosamine-6-phosphate deacetylase [Coriobacteriia bacterium]